MSYSSYSSSSSSEDDDDDDDDDTTWTVDDVEHKLDEEKMRHWARFLFSVLVRGDLHDADLVRLPPVFLKDEDVPTPEKSQLIDWQRAIDRPWGRLNSRFLDHFDHLAYCRYTLKRQTPTDRDLEYQCLTIARLAFFGCRLRIKSFLEEHQYHVDERAVNYAILGRHFALARWLHTRYGCPTNEDTCVLFAVCGRYKDIDWLHSHTDCPWFHKHEATLTNRPSSSSSCDVELDLSRVAARLAKLQWAHAHGYKGVDVSSKAVHARTMGKLPTMSHFVGRTNSFMGAILVHHGGHCFDQHQDVLVRNARTHLKENYECWHMTTTTKGVETGTAKTTRSFTPKTARAAAAPLKQEHAPLSSRAVLQTVHYPFSHLTRHATTIAAMSSSDEKTH